MKRSKISDPPEDWPAGQAWMSRSYQSEELILERVQFCEEGLERIEGLLKEILEELRHDDR